MTASRFDPRFRQRPRWFPLGGAWLAPLAVAAFLFGCGGDDDGDVTPEELTQRLLPAAELQLTSEREFEWDNATDFIVEGVHTPEGTAPSEIIDEIDDAGFVAAAGVSFTDEARERFASVNAAAFDSEDGATEARDTLHEEDLKQPCFAACVVNPVDYEVESVPNSVAVHQVPQEAKPPPGLFKFEAYSLEFTIGSELYVLQADGPPGAITSAEFDRWAKAFYEQAAAHD